MTKRSPRSKRSRSPTRPKKPTPTGKVRRQGNRVEIQTIRGGKKAAKKEVVQEEAPVAVVVEGAMMELEPSISPEIKETIDQSLSMQSPAPKGTAGDPSTPRVKGEDALTPSTSAEGSTPIGSGSPEVETAPAAVEPENAASKRKQKRAAKAKAELEAAAAAVKKAEEEALKAKKAEEAAKAASSQPQEPQLSKKKAKKAKAAAQAEAEAAPAPSLSTASESQSSNPLASPTTSTTSGATALTKSKKKSKSSGKKKGGDDSDDDFDITILHPGKDIQAKREEEAKMVELRKQQVELDKVREQAAKRAAEVRKKTEQKAKEAAAQHDSTPTNSGFEGTQNLASPLEPSSLSYDDEDSYPLMNQSVSLGSNQSQNLKSGEYLSSYFDGESSFWSPELREMRSLPVYLRGAEVKKVTLEDEEKQRGSVPMCPDFESEDAGYSMLVDHSYGPSSMVDNFSEAGLEPSLADLAELAHVLGCASVYLYQTGEGKYVARADFTERVSAKACSEYNDGRGFRGGFLRTSVV